MLQHVAGRSLVVPTQPAGGCTPVDSIPCACPTVPAYPRLEGAPAGDRGKTAMGSGCRQASVPWLATVAWQLTTTAMWDAIVANCIPHSRTTRERCPAVHMRRCVVWHPIGTPWASGSGVPAVARGSGSACRNLADLTSTLTLARDHSACLGPTWTRPTLHLPRTLSSAEFCIPHGPVERRYLYQYPMLHKQLSFPR